MNFNDYWEDCVAEALAAEGVHATPEQICAVASWVATAHECHSMYHGHDVATANFHAEREREKNDLREQLDRERNKIPCPECEGKKVPTLNGGIMPARFICWRCDRTGRIDP